MKILLVLLICFYVVKKLKCETITANQKQQKLIEDSKDFNANPCEDFYQYACGNWKKLHKEVDDKYHETLGLLDYNANQEMARLFTEMNIQNETTFVKKAYQYYISCYELEGYETLNYLNLITKYEKLNFPTLDRSRQMPEDFNWLRTLAIMRIYGLNDIFIKENLEENRYDDFEFIIDLDKPSFTTLTLDNFVQIIKSIGEPINDVSKLWHEVQTFEYQLQNVDAFKIRQPVEDSESEEDYDDEDDDDDEEEKDDKLKDNNVLQKPLRTIDELPLPWLKDYIQILLNQTNLKAETKIYLHNIPYFMALDDLLGRYSHMFICKYLEIRFLGHLYLQRPIKRSLPFPRRYEDCIPNVRRFLPMIMYWLYEQQHPYLTLEYPNVTKLFEDIRNQFSKTIKQNEYGFSETVVDYLLEKINDMDLQLNNIPHVDTLKTMLEFYDVLDLNDDDFYGNDLKLMKFYFKASHNVLVREQYDFFLENWNTAVNSAPYFIEGANTLVVPITLLQQPIYDSNFDDIYINSSLGFLLAHAMFHGFDNIGLEYDYSGIMVFEQYNNIFTNSLFNVRFNCFLEFDPADLKIKIADISGLHYAYKLFNASRTDNMDNSLSELFFLNFAQLFCSTSDSENDVSSGRSRITDALTHFPEFSNVFKCNTKNQMYTHKECRLW